ncbi:MAG: aminopeptidase P family protein [Victivallales bacterium]|nr:aminopeptidase P family protein [Victivallales bacterium]
MSRLIYASSEQSADLWYVTGFNVPDPILWFQVGELSAIVVGSLELGRAQKQCKPGVTVIDAAKLREFFHLPEETEEEKKCHWFVKQVSAVAQGTGENTWEVPERFPLVFGDLLREAGFTVKTQWNFCPERAVKSPEEIEKIRHSERLAEAGLAQADGMLRSATIGDDGFLHLGGHILTAEELRSAIDLEITRLGGLAQGTITAPGPQGADPHQHGEGPIKANEPIVMDIFPRDQATGYFGDLTRTRVKGKASEVVHKAYETVLTAQEKVLTSLKAGVQGKEMHNMVVENFKAAGYETGTDPQTGVYHGFFHSLGHSVGLEIHEGPGLSAGEDRAMVAGNVVTDEPGLYYPEWGGIRIEDTVAVTETGVDNLAVAPKFLEIE